MTIVEILVHYREGLWGGLAVTLRLCSIIWLAGIGGGVLLGIAARASEEVGKALTGLHFFLSSLPVVILLFWLNYPLQEALGVVIDPFLTAAAALSLVNLIGVAQLVRGALRDFPRHYVMAAQVCGMSRKAIVRHIELPLVFRQVLPGLLGLQVLMLQSTLFASFISVEDVFRVAQRINAETYQPIEVYTGLAFFFLAICLPLNLLASFLKQRFTRDLSEV